MTHKDLKYWAWGIVAILSAILVFLCLQLWREYRHNTRIETVSTERATFTTLLSHRAPLTTADTAYIQNWMTFDYINSVYKLSPTYLESTLAISDAHYPHISIMHYAHENKMTSAAFLSLIKNAVASYGTTTSPSLSASTSTTPH